MAVLPTGIGPVTGGYQIERSLRFNSADSAYLNRTLSSSGDMKVFTLSFWLKQTALGVINNLFTVRNAIGSGTEYFQIKYNANDTISVIGRDSGSVVRCNVSSTAVFRDPGAWAHIVISFNASSTTLNVYANNVVIANSTSIGNVNYGWNNSSLTYHRIGDGALLGEANLNGYMAELYHVDGQALTPSSFGETDSNTGVWKPKAFSGTYGTNGFYLKFADNSGTTSTTLGKDSSGNGNNWTPNNFSVTAGAGNDSLVDSPTNYGTDTGVGGEVRGNYCTFNPLDKNSNGSLVNGNLDHSNGSANNAGIRSTFAFPSSDKWYAELRVNTTTSGSIGHGFGFATSTADLTGAADTANKYDIYASSSISIFSNGSTITSGAGVFTAGDIIQVAYDGATGKAWLGRNNTWYNSSGGTTGNPGAGTNQTFTLTGQMFIYSYCFSASGSLNCGQRAFAYTAPSGFKALCTQNLPTPTIGATSTTQANYYFDTKLWSGNSSTQSIALNFAPDLIWNKSRNSASNHAWWDVLRGTGAVISSSTTEAETTGYNAITSFSSNAISLGPDNTGVNNGRTNETGRTYVGWVWNAGDSTVTNTSGTISAQVRASTTSGFSVVTYTGTGANATVGHGLGVAPSMVIVKNRTNAGQFWAVGHSSLTSWANGVYLNSTAAQASATTLFNSTAPTSTVFSVGTSGDTNGSTHNMVAYCFAPVAGYSAFGSYVGNNSSDGPFVYTGFRPRFVMIKDTTSTGFWWLGDSARATYNVVAASLFPNNSNAESSAYNECDFLSNGFKWRADNANSWPNNANGNTYIYAAFAEFPFKFSLAR